MSAQRTLVDYLKRSARRHPDRVAVKDPPDRAITYRDLDALSDRVGERLRHVGVRPRDRVGIYMRKSIDTVATIFGVLKSGAAYVPVDASAPASRNAYILDNCSVRAVVLESRSASDFGGEMEQLGEMPRLLLIDGSGGLPMEEALDREQQRDPAPASHTVVPDEDDPAYLLYTSGSTGKPKGVVLTHLNAVSFVEWCAQTFEPTTDDRFSSHAPFHFDLSILDLYLPIKHGATLVLVNEETGKDPVRLARLISEHQISVWYSTPSILSLLTQYGRLDRHDYRSLRTVLFAGEVFPVKHLRALKNLLPAPRYFNLYGPTETNVCTWYEIPDFIPEDRNEPFPIGKACSHLMTRVVTEQGEDVPAGEEGELVVAGPGVMGGYWQLPEQTAGAFLVDAAGDRWYRTGDIVVEEGDGNYRFVGRRDRMVKRRGYRIELGEIEAGLYRHPNIREAAAVAIADQDTGTRINAFISCRNGDQPSVIEMKAFCVEALPAYMVPDRFFFLDSLPKTSTEKVDYQSLKQLILRD